MPIFAKRLPLFCHAFAFVLFVALPLAHGATLGRGMEQLVSLYETGNPKLASVMRRQLTNVNGEVLVHIRIDPSAVVADVVAGLVASGFRLQAISELDPTLLEGYISLEGARAAASVPGVVHVLAVQRPVAFAGSVQSQAVSVQKADRAQTRGIDGTGIRVGVLSDTFGLLTTHPNAADDVASGDLPADVVVLEDSDFGDDEGRAMLQLVHDVAPGSKLAFATAFNGEVSFSNNILNLRRLFKADVIADDVIYLDEPMFSDGLLAQTVDRVVAEGAAYFASAGNSGLEAYEARYDAVPLAAAKALVASGKENIDLDALAANGFTPGSFHNFRNPDGSTRITQGFISYFGDFVDFQWDEPFDLGKVRTNLDIYVFDAAGHFINPYDAFSDAWFTSDDNTLTDQALEFLYVNPGTYQIVIANVNGGPAQHIKYVADDGGESERQNAGSIWGHAAARHGQAVAAMFYGITNRPEDYSSPGPVRIYFDKRGRRLEDPEVRQVPQITAVDGADTTFFGAVDVDGNGFLNFFGTSAAAPDAAAVAALVLQSSGGPGSLDPEGVYQRLQRTATPIPLPVDRLLAVAVAGPLVATADGDFPLENTFWQLRLAPFAKETVRNVTINLTSPDMTFIDPAGGFAGLHLGSLHGLNPNDVTVSGSVDLKSLTLTFKPGSFAAGESIAFGNYAYPTTGLPFLFQVDADRVEGGQVVVNLSDGSTKTGTFRVDRAERENRFTGAGLVNADRATRP